MVKEKRFLIIVKDNCIGENPEGVTCEEVITILIEAVDELEVEIIFEIGKPLKELAET